MTSNVKNLFSNTGPLLLDSKKNRLKFEPKHWPFFNYIFKILFLKPFILSFIPIKTYFFLLCSYLTEKSFLICGSNFCNKYRAIFVIIFMHDSDYYLLKSKLMDITQQLIISITDNLKNIPPD